MSVENCLEQIEVKDESNYYDAIVKNLCDMYIRKNSDYGNSYAKALDEDGLIVSKVLLGIKMDRFSSLQKQPALVEESLMDTLMDMANYAIMTAAWLLKEESKVEDK